MSLLRGLCTQTVAVAVKCHAEIRAARILGADAVGMSTVTEALTAAHCGMPLMCLSVMTNMAAGVLPQKLSHQEVVETAARVHDTFHSLVDLVLKSVWFS